MLELPNPLPQVNGVVEERPVALARGLQFVEKHAKSETWNWLILAIFASFSGSLPWWLVGWCGSGTPISGYVRLFARELERHHLRDVGLKRQHLQVEHQLRMVSERCRDAHRPIKVGCRIAGRSRLGALDLTLDFANRVQY